MTEKIHAVEDIKPPERDYKYKCVIQAFSFYWNDKCIEKLETEPFITTKNRGNITMSGETFESFWEIIDYPIYRSLIPAYRITNAKNKCRQIKFTCDFSKKSIFNSDIPQKVISEDKPFPWKWRTEKTVTYIEPSFEDIKNQPAWLVYNYLKEREDI